MSVVAGVLAAGPMSPVYLYGAQAVRVIDGDTVVVRVDLGFRLSLETPVRLLGVNAPEMSTPEGHQAHDFTASWVLSASAGLVILSAKPGRFGDKYGRWLARVFDRATGHCLNDDLLTAGHAVVMKE